MSFDQSDGVDELMVMIGRRSDGERLVAPLAKLVEEGEEVVGQREYFSVLWGCTEASPPLSRRAPTGDWYTAPNQRSLTHGARAIEALTMQCPKRRIGSEWKI